MRAGFCCWCCCCYLWVHRIIIIVLRSVLDECRTCSPWFHIALFLSSFLSGISLFVRRLNHLPKWLHGHIMYLNLLPLDLPLSLPLSLYFVFLSPFRSRKASCKTENKLNKLKNYRSSELAFLFFFSFSSFHIFGFFFSVFFVCWFYHLIAHWWRWVY